MVTNCTRLSFISFIAAVSILLSSLGFAGTEDIFRALARTTAKVSDDIPTRQLDDLASRIGRSKAFQRSIDDIIEGSSKVSHHASPALRAAARSDEVMRLLKQTIGNADPSLLRGVSQMDDASRSLGLALSRGGKALQEAVPDVALRGKLVRSGGPEILTTIGIHGDDALRSTIRVNEAIAAGTLRAPNGLRAVSLADFGQAMTKFGDASWTFWQRYVTPHWKLWLGGGALGAYLLNPEGFQDAAGALTEKGFQHLTELAGRMAAEAIRGLEQGSITAGQEVIDAATEAYVRSFSAKMLIGIFVFLLATSFFFRRTRYYLLRPIAWLNRVPAGKSS